MPDEQSWMEKLGVVKDIGEIKTELVRLNANLSESNRVQSEHHRTLYGHNGELGLDKTVDRLNEKEKLRGVWYAASVALIIERAWSWVAHGGH